MIRRLVMPMALALAAAAPAQMSGTYLIDPSGSGASFPTFTAAVNAMFVAGVSGPVDFLIFPGAYTESVLVPPINGMSTTNTVTFHPLVAPGTVSLSGANGDVFALLGVGFLHNQGFVWEGLDFTGGPGFAISGIPFCEGNEISHCTFAPNFLNTQAGTYYNAFIYSENNGNELGWKIHHSQFQVMPRSNRQSYAIYESNTGGWEMHHNSFDLNGCDCAIFMINGNLRLDTIYDNLFTGALVFNGSTDASSTCVIQGAYSNFTNDIVNNTFLVTIPGSGCCVSTAGYNNGAQGVQNRITGNIFSLTAGGTCICAQTYSPPTYYMQLDENVYWAPAGEIGRLIDYSLPAPYYTAFTTLASWQTATGVDANSQQADPLFVNGVAAPYDLHVATGSPAINLGTPSLGYLIDDYEGRFRDGAPDSGAYESTNFAVFGQGCAGTGGLTPTISGSGTVAIGSANFAVNLTNAASNSLAFLEMGLNYTNYNGVPLPYDLGGGCLILVAPAVAVTGVTSGTGTATRSLPIPNNTGLLGHSVYMQWIVVDAGSSSPFGVTTSSAGALQL